MTPHERSPYSAIVDRPPLKLPNGGKVIIWTIVNLEVWDLSRPMPRTAMPAPSGQTMLPDVTNWAWHEYGMRVGVWRYFKLFEKLGIRPTLSCNARVCEDYERVAAQARGAGWEFMAHGYDQIPMHKLEDQRGTIHKAMDVIEKFTGERPVGWLGPGLTQTLDTPDLLTEAGVKYIGDWVYDDEPTTISTTNGPLVTLPYNFETHDIATMILQNHELPYWVTKVSRYACPLFGGKFRAHEDHGDRASSLHHGAAASDRLSRTSLRRHQQPRGRGAYERG